MRRWPVAAVVVCLAGCGGDGAAKEDEKPATAADARATFIRKAERACKKHFAKRVKLETAVARIETPAQARRAGDRLATLFDDVIPLLKAQAPPAADQEALGAYYNRLAGASTYVQVTIDWLLKGDPRSAKNALGLANTQLYEARKRGRKYGFKHCAPRELTFKE